MVIEMFTKLFVIRIVTNKVLGFWRISRTKCSLRFEDDSSSLMSLGCSEKYAVSLEEAIAEQSKSMHIIIKQITTLVDMPMKKGSAVTVESRHIRGSIEAISKIKRFTITSAKIRKKTTRPQDYKTKSFLSHQVTKSLRYLSHFHLET